MSDNVAHALAGAGGGLLSMIATYPLITVSTRAQIESKNKETSILDALKHIMKQEGVAGLYSGLESAVFGITITNAVYYYCYELTKSSFQSGKRGLTTVESMIAGAVAGSITVIATNPIWVVNTRLTARKQSVDDDKSSLEQPSTWSAIKTILKRDGIKEFWSGVVPALVLVINPILQYTIFEQLKNVIERKRKLTPIDAFLLGAIGKLIATGVTYPYLTVKSLMQLKQTDKRYGNMKSALKKVIEERGLLGVYRGVGAKAIQSVITAAFLFMFKESLYNASTKVLSTVGQKK